MSTFHNRFFIFSLSITLWRYIQVACINNPFLSVVEWCFVILLYHNLYYFVLFKKTKSKFSKFEDLLDTLPCDS